MISPWVAHQSRRTVVACCSFFPSPIQERLNKKHHNFLTGNSEIGADPERTDLVFHAPFESTPKDIPALAALGITFR